MKTKLIEVTNGFNWGKFMVGRFDEEWSTRSAVADRPWSLLGQRGWTQDHLLVLDLETGEGAIFRPGGMAKADLNKHSVWVCPMFEPFLVWLYRQDLTDIDTLPALVELTEREAPSSLHGYRRTGEEWVERAMRHADPALADEDMESELAARAAEREAE